MYFVDGVGIAVTVAGAGADCPWGVLAGGVSASTGCASGAGWPPFAGAMSGSGSESIKLMMRRYLNLGPSPPTPVLVVFGLDPALARKW